MIASMGPRLFSVDDKDSSKVFCICLFIASMGPRLFSVDDLCCHCSSPLGWLASMGPRLFSVDDQFRCRCLSSS